MTNDLQPGDKVRVTLHRNGYYKDTKIGRVVRITPTGRVVVECAYFERPRAFDPSNVRKTD